jgi:hypothetical protein
MQRGVVAMAILSKAAVDHGSTRASALAVTLAPLAV